MNDVYQIAFRVSKGRYQKFGLHHRNALLLPSLELAEPYLSSNHDVFITPLNSAAAPSSSETEDLCLVKVYSESNENPVISYWEPKATTKTLGSVVFRYYRQKFLQHAWTTIDDHLVVWTDMENIGDNNIRGYTRNHWESLASYFNREHAIGRLISEPVWDRKEDETVFQPFGKWAPFLCTASFQPQ